MLHIAIPDLACGVENTMPNATYIHLLCSDPVILCNVAYFMDLDKPCNFMILYCTHLMRYHNGPMVLQ
jgi:hypothetical protein